MVRCCLPSLTRGTGSEGICRFFGGFLRGVDPAAGTERFCGAGGGGQQRVGLLIDVVEKSDSFSPWHRLEHHVKHHLGKFTTVRKMYFSARLKSVSFRFLQCCGSGYGIRCLFDCWIRDTGWVKNQDPDPG